jgi:polyisoprenoid-binding protein YceI
MTLKFNLKIQLTMKKGIFAMVMWSASMLVTAQTSITKDGVIEFNATSKTSADKIEAKNTKTVATINATTGAIEVGVLVAGFHFESALMEEHFNENYLESKKFKSAIFKGLITNLKEVNLKKDGSYPVKVSGKLTMHGVTKDVTTEGKVVVKNGIISEAQATFTTKLADYGVAIPSLVKDKVATEAKLKVHLKDMKKK